MPIMAKMPGINEILSDPEVFAAMDPKVMVVSWLHLCCGGKIS